MQKSRRLSQSLILVLAGVAVLIVFFLVFVMPSTREISNLDMEIAKAKFRIDTQEKLGPLYKGLEEKLKKIDRQARLTPSQPIPKIQLNNFSGAVTGIAQKSNLSLLSVYPETINSDTASTVYNVNLRGNFTDFRNFLYEIGRLTYVDTVQEIQITTRKGSREFNVKIKLLVA